MSTSGSKDRDLPPVGDPPPDDHAEEGLRTFFRNFLPVIFERAILGAVTDEERAELAHKFAMSPNTDFESINHLLRLCAHVEHNEHRHDDAQVLLQYAKMVSNTFLHHRTEKRRHGLSLQYLFNDTAIVSIGHALNEGYTE